ncbi:multimerin-2-like isoform X2 [Syngnathoides biaculeatus]|uniref:multimerin-2-like isoform X2 n=1 Tax=Syngnathoides biaculeatus TaxID=300417 RepID=UPI002ADD4343|nr:multimerin-2-like isoform X2 [Syngnathoides biaculeatus]
MEGTTRPEVGTEPDPVRSRWRLLRSRRNWCAFVQKRTVTVAVACGTEKYTIKSQSPCPSGTPDCHLIMYKLSTRPLYRQNQKVTTALLWRCCPGHGGDNCDDAAADAQTDSATSPQIGGTGVQRAPGSLHAAGVSTQQQRSDPNREQNDHQGSVNTSHSVSRAQSHEDRARHQDRVQHPVHVPSQEHAQYPIRVPNQDHVQHPTREPHRDNVRYPVRVQDPDPEPKPTLVQQPVHGQNREHVPHPARKHDQQERLHPGSYEDAAPPVSREAAAVAAPAALPLPHMVALLMSQLQPTLQHFNRSLEQLGRRVDQLARDATRPESDESLRREAALRQQLEGELHSQHATLQYNITNLKTDLDLKIKRQNKMLHASLQALNASLAEIKLEQEVEQEQEQEQERKKEQQGAEPGPPPEGVRLTMSEIPAPTAVWEAIERLDNMVVNNSIKVEELTENVEVMLSGLRHLRREAEALRDRVDQTARSGQVQFMETGLEVEAAKVAVLDRVEQLAGNLTRQGQRLQEMDVDVDYLYSVLYKNDSSDCDCRRLDEALGRLQGGVVNATELANKNRLALEEGRRREAAQRALQGSLQQVKEWMTAERSRTTALESSVRRLSVLVREVRAQAETRGSADPPASEEIERVLAEMKRLSASFNSLLKDAIRHSDVLEILLGEEVLEFLEWPVQDQEAHSIPALKENLRVLRQMLGGRNLSLAADEPGGAEEAPSADEPSRWSPGVAGWGQPSGDGGDLWKLERSVEELKVNLRQMEEATCCGPAEERRQEEATSALRADVAQLRRGLEEHLRTFESVFSNADVLERSRVALELDKLHRILVNKEKKKKKRDGGRRSRRVAPDVPAGGTFRAPVDGVYVFTLAVDVKPPGARATSRPVARSAGLRLREGEELRLELRGGEWAESRDGTPNVARRPRGT